MAIFTDKWQRNDFIVSTIVEKGDSVKIKNTKNGHSETFWVIVTEVIGDNIIGTVNNHLFFETPYNFGDIVTFKKKDIRDHKNSAIKQKQHLALTFMVSLISKKLGRVPTVEELDDIFTVFTQINPS
jgi:hypothetical protein